MRKDHSVKKATFRQTLGINYEYAFRARTSRCLVAIGKRFFFLRPLRIFPEFRIEEIPNEAGYSRGRFHSPISS